MVFPRKNDPNEHTSWRRRRHPARRRCALHLPARNLPRPSLPGSQASASPANQPRSVPFQFPPRSPAPPLLSLSSSYQARRYKRRAGRGVGCGTHPAVAAGFWLAAPAPTEQRALKRRCWPSRRLESERVTVVLTLYTRCPRGGLPTTRGLHSSTFQLNLSRV